MSGLVLISLFRIKFGIVFNFSIQDNVRSSVNKSIQDNVRYSVYFSIQDNVRSSAYKSIQNNIRFSFITVFRIRFILIWIRILGSVSWNNKSRSGTGSSSGSERENTNFEKLFFLLKIICLKLNLFSYLFLNISVR